MYIGKSPKSTPGNDLIARTEVKKRMAHAYFETIFKRQVMKAGFMCICEKG